MKTSLTDLIRHFDALAPQCVDFTDGIQGTWDRDMHQEVLNNAELQDHSVLLELGCGTGRFTHLLAPHLKGAFAIDCAPNMLRMARERTPASDTVQWIPGDIRSLPPTPGIDTAVMCNTLRYLDADERRALYKTIYDRLPLAGLLVIGDLLWSMPPDMVEGAEDWQDAAWSYTLMASEVERELQKIGFDTFVRRMHPAISVVRASKVPVRPRR